MIYIGSSSRVVERVRAHCRGYYLEKYCQEPKYEYLHKCIEDGKTITFRILDTEIDKNNRYKVEKSYIEKYQPRLNILWTPRNICSFSDIQDNTHLDHSETVDMAELEERVCLENWDHYSPIYVYDSAMQQLNMIEDSDKIAYILEELPFIACFANLKAAARYKANLENML